MPSSTVTVAGRAVGTRWFGADTGPVVLWCHGGLSDAGDGALMHATAVERGVRLLAVDRPGLGASAPQPGRDTAAFTPVVAGVLDALGIEVLAGAVGWSLGGQYALAAGRLGERVPRVAVLAGVPPLDRPGVRAGLHRIDRTLLSLSGRRVPRPVTRLAFAVTGRGVRMQAATARRRPERGRRADERSLGPADADAFAGPSGPALRAAMVAATGKASAEVEEYRAWHRPWGFVPAEVTVPVTLWRGEQDRMVTAAMVDQLAAELPAARLRTLPGVGHLLPAVAGDAVLDDLLGPA